MISTPIDLAVELGETPWPAYYDSDPRMAWVGKLDPRFLAALTAPRGAYVPGPIPRPERTLGWRWVSWIRGNCVMGEGDWAGQPARPELWQRALLWKLAEIHDDGRRRYEFALISLGKGAGKSPIGGWVGSVDLAGPSVTCLGTDAKGEPCKKCVGGFGPDGLPHPVRRASPDVIVIAATEDQAKLIFDEIHTTFEDGPRAEDATVMEKTVALKGRRGEARMLPMTAKRLDGSKGTTLLADEMHEVDTELRQKAYEVASGGTAKRRDGLTVVFSTAGADLSTLFGQMHARGQRGEFAHEELYLYMGADETLDPTSDADIAEGIRQANPLAACGVANVRALVRKFKAMPLFRALRYYWNRWVPTDAAWLPAGAWDNCKARPEDRWVVDPSLPTYVGADMALTRDSAAVVMVQRREDGLLQASARIWFPSGERIDQAEVDDYLRAIEGAYNLQWIAADEAWWPTLTDLEAEGLPIFRMPQQGRNMVIAYARTYRVIVDRILLHDGAPDYSDQISSAAPHSSDRGWTLKKGKHHRRIDACPATAGAIFATTLEPREVEKPMQKPWVV